MPLKQTRERAQRKKAQGKSPSTQAGEFVREEIHHVREGKHGVRSPKQAIAIGLSKARKAGVKLLPPNATATSTKTHRSAALAYKKGQGGSTRRASRRRSRAASSALKREAHKAASPRALARQGRAAAAHRSPSSRSASTRRASRTKGRKARSTSGKAARTRAREG